MSGTTLDGWAWCPFFDADPRAWVLGSDEPAAHWLLLASLPGLGATPGELEGERQASLADARTQDLLARLGDWEAGEHLSGHDSPAFAPHQLALLADHGVRAGDDARVDRVLAQMLEHQDAEGRFQSYAPPKRGEDPVWGGLLCDAHAVLEVLVRYGFGSDQRVRAALVRMGADLASTAQGRAWPCRRDPVVGFRGPGRVADCCPLVTVQALRTYGLLPEPQRPADAREAARVLLSLWRDRGEHLPYQFGHGQRFKAAKWPPTWYHADTVLDALGRFPALWRNGADPDDRRALAELAASLVAYNLDAQGRAVPHSASRGFEGHSFGQKREPSPFATARILAVLARLDDLAPDALAVDVRALGSSKGGAGTAIPPPAR